MTLVAHISDVHLAPLPPVSPRELLSKRITGYVNWKTNRSRGMHSNTVDALVAHMKNARPDMIAVTGDLVNLATSAEFARARHWLESLGQPQSVCAIPGNHDVYVRDSLAAAQKAFGPYMQGETLDAAAFPYIRRIGEVALIGCNSAVPMPPFVAAGNIDAAQLERLGRMLDLLKQDGLFRIVMIHHPPAGPDATSWRRGLRNASQFQETIVEHGAELVLHGHLHEATVNGIHTAAGEIPVIGVAAASADPKSGEQPARYNLFRIEKLRKGWSCKLAEYGYQRIGDEIVKRLQVRLY